MRQGWTVLAVAAALLAAAPAVALADPPAVTLDGPSGPTKDASPTFTFGTDDALAVLSCRLDGPTPLAEQPCASPLRLGPLADGDYTFVVHATDPVTGVGEAMHTFTVDTAPPPAPVITAPADGATVAGPNVTVSGTAETGAGVDISDGATVVGHATASDGTWSAAVPLPDGPHTLTAVATDAAGNASPPSDARTVTVDSVAPETTFDSHPPALTNRASATFVVSASEDGSTFECRLTGPGHAEDFATCGATAQYTGLADGDYTFAARARDAAGNTDATPATWAFTVDTTPPPAPLPSPSPQPLPAPIARPPAPVFHSTVVARPGFADVRIRLPGSARYARLGADRAVPLGTVFDTRRGSVQIVSIPRRGAAPQHASFGGGVFRVTQRGGTTVLTLVGSCRPAHRLSGDGRGAFQVRGRFSSATVRNARWVVRDSCAGTLTRALEGIVQVRDQVRRRTVLVRAGRRYLARPHR